MSNLIRKSHFLGTKFRNLRKRNGLTLQDVTSRCIQINADVAPSVPYLSMIETGKRTPSEDVLDLLATVFQKSPRWFLDENADLKTLRTETRRGAQSRIPLEPGFLFSRNLLETAIPELLSQTGTSGRQFAHLMIRSLQESLQNEFPDLERSAEDIGGRRFPLTVNDLLDLTKQHGLKIRWFEHDSIRVNANDQKFATMVRSFFEAPAKIYINQRLKNDPARLKYELATHLGHKILHDGDGLRSVHATGGQLGGSPETGAYITDVMQSTDVLCAWRDFECGFFAEALLCPKQPFRRFLMREHHRIEARHKVELTPAVMMRRMTATSNYRHWHYFDAYPPGHLRSVYRGNGIPLPWGNMSMASDPCPRWAVFFMLNQPQARKPSSQISILQNEDRSLLYCCHSFRTKDSAGNTHVLSVGIDLAPALESQGFDTIDLIGDIAERCRQSGGQALPTVATKRAIRSTGRVLNIDWVTDAIEKPASIICPRSAACPRPKQCADLPSATRATEIGLIRDKIINDCKTQE
ncbi:MAG: DUF3612 domain-containing protein [Gammaproteobacteria bacterium]|jgi:transcriptional regulator with XRE-family HTH domain|nr:MerR family transcriptional regulator [Chromatiales bacterium]MCP4925737.1 DUF3612 domain-containing protein [Gammaproteobacteria bacterium]MDP7419404.1 DUF3612 domain-containing protein [Gammaproteobacteria bacterium]MDP7660070.1 DUF3612 domain-containing protein [Gammaproteobacteria bacterium]HJP37819.1 DUF3612 domain-containing protein [Gammaproteobacteria bacterium]